MLIDEALNILKTRLEAITCLTVTTDPGAVVVPPMAVVTDGEIDYLESMRRGAALMAFTVTVYLSRADQPEGLREARGYLSGHGEFSVRAALETQPAGGDELLSKVVVDAGRSGSVERPSGETYIAATFDCRSHVPGDPPT